MKLLVLLGSMLMFSGCATILNNELQTINVTSSAPSVKGTVDGVPFTGPGVINVKRAKEDKLILIETPSCSKQVALQSTVDPKFFINILSGGTFGSSTDYASDKMWKYQDQVVIPCK